MALAEDLPGVAYIAGDEPGEPVNPHLWLDVEYAAKYAERIAEALAAADPEHAADYEASLAAYATELAALDAEAAETLGSIPEADRTVIAFHDAFPYFAAAYGLTVDGTIVSAPGQDPSAGDLADLIRVVEANGVKAILAEAQFNDDLARTIADETGATVVSDLLTDSVGDAPQDTYVGAMRWNVEQVAAALRGALTPAGQLGPSLAESPPSARRGWGCPRGRRPGSPRGSRPRPRVAPHPPARARRRAPPPARR